MSLIPHIGEICALGTAVLWALAVILFKLSGLKIRPLGLNLFKNTLGLTCLLLTFPFLNEVLIYDAPWEDYLWLILSGVIGISLSDTLFFASLNRLGASNIALIECLYSPFVILIAFFFLAERLSWGDLFGAILIIASVLLPSLGHQKVSEIPQKDRIKGLVLGVLAMLTVSSAIVLVKPLIERHPLVWVTTMRMVGGVLGLLLYAVFHPERKSFFEGFRPQSAWKVAIPASLLASYLVLMLWIAGFKFADASVVGLLNQTSVIFLTLFAMLFLREKITPRKMVAILLALSGSVLVIL